MQQVWAKQGTWKSSLAEGPVAIAFWSVRSCSSAALAFWRSFENLWLVLSLSLGWRRLLIYCLSRYLGRNSCNYRCLRMWFLKLMKVYAAEGCPGREWAATCSSCPWIRRVAHRSYLSQYRADDFFCLCSDLPSWFFVPDYLHCRRR